MLKIILLLNPVYVTLFWALVLNFQNPLRHAPKVFLGRFMVVAFLLYLSHFFYFQKLFLIYQYLEPLYLLTSLLVYPLYHIYVRLLTVDERFSISAHGPYLLLPFLVFLVSTLAHVSMDSAENQYYFQQVLGAHQKPMADQVLAFWVYQSARLIFVIQVFAYLYLNFRLIFRHNQKLQNFYSNLEYRRLNGVQFFNISLSLTSLFGIIAALLGRETFLETEYALLAPSLVFSSMLFFIGYLGLQQQSVITQKETALAEQPPEDDLPSLETSREDLLLEKLKKDMEKLFEKEKLYINPDLKIWDVSSRLGSNRTYVSRVINQAYGRNFCAHINHYRVLHAKKLLKVQSDLTNEQISDLSGFGSVNSFYRAFLAEEKISLSQYRQQMQSAKKASPSAKD